VATGVVAGSGSRLIPQPIALELLDFEADLFAFVGGFFAVITDGEGFNAEVEELEMLVDDLFTDQVEAEEVGLAGAGEAGGDGLDVLVAGVRQRSVAAAEEFLCKSTHDRDSERRNRNFGFQVRNAKREPSTSDIIVGRRGF
jgi:hypothetical protein